jgi:hypothetical protein
MGAENHLFFVTQRDFEIQKNRRKFAKFRKIAVRAQCERWETTAGNAQDLPSQERRRTKTV